MVIKAKSKKEREESVLNGLVSLYIKDGVPVGSETLKNNGFETLSSATIRNYFSKLEANDYLMQHHTSGGRVPTEKAYKFYIETIINQRSISQDNKLFLDNTLSRETKDISAFFQQSIEALSSLTNSAIFISSPRFDQDSISSIKLVTIDDKKLLCILITDLGLVHTQTVFTPNNFSQFSLKRIESYFLYRLTSLNKPQLSDSEEFFAKNIYNEIALRHFINYSTMNEEEVYKCGFSKLLHYPEFLDPVTLSSNLALFESSLSIKKMILTAFEKKDLSVSIGSDIQDFISSPYTSSLLTAPYSIDNKIVGVVAILGPMRLNYKRFIGILDYFSKLISTQLSKKINHYKLSYREPIYTSVDLKNQHKTAISYQSKNLIENKTND